MSGRVPNNETPQPVLAGGTPLIFDWSPVRWRKTRLMIALVLAAGGHLLVFYLFQVVTESGPRHAPPVREALILSGTETSSRQILEGVADRLPVLSPPVPLENREEDLSVLVKGYVPTWQNHRPQLKPLPGQADAAPLPALVPASSGMLPPLPAAVSTGTHRTKPPSGGLLARPYPVLGFQSGLADRPITVDAQWPPEVVSPDWPEEGPVSFLLSVDPAGKVISCLSLGASTGLEEEEVELLRKGLLKLKFAARPHSPDDAWGWVDVLW